MWGKYLHLQEKMQRLPSEILSNLLKATQLRRQNLNWNLDLSGSPIHSRDSYSFNVGHFSWVRFHLVSSCPFPFDI